MFYWLTELSDKISFFNVFRYITFRTGGAIVTALVFVFLFGGPIIDLLRLKQGKGQPIRSDGPPSHLVTKKGTPTMGRANAFLASRVTAIATGFRSLKNFNRHWQSKITFTGNPLRPQVITAGRIPYAMLSSIWSEAFLKSRKPPSPPCWSPKGGGICT